MRHVFDPWVGKIPWRRAWQPTPVFLLGISCTEESAGLQAIGSQSQTRLEQVTARTYLLGTNFKFATRRPRSVGVMAINAGGILGFGGGGGG